MRAKELLKILRAQPFQPLRLHISSGEYVDIHHPEFALVTQSLVAIGIAKKSGAVADYLVHYNLLHVVKVKPLNGRKAKHGSNGRDKA